MVKNINAMQGFGSMDILCVDKTGTLTGDRISLEYYMDILGNENQAVLDLAYINSCYHTGVQNHLDAALLKCREMPGKGDHFQQLSAQHPKLDELPFDYDRKFASVLVKGKEKICSWSREVFRRCAAAAALQNTKAHKGKWASFKKLSHKILLHLSRNVPPI